jgi:hypothetical protein
MEVAMTTDTIAPGLRDEARVLSAEAEVQTETGTIAVNAAKVLETTRRAWSEASTQAPAKAERRASKRLRARWPRPGLFDLAALHYWSPKPL